MMDVSLPASHKRATFRSLYSETALHQAVLQVYTKPLFSWRKALCRSHDGRTLYDFARYTPQHVAALHKALSNQSVQFRPALPVHYNFNGKQRTIYVFPWEERIVDRLLFHTLNRHFHSVFSKNSYAYRFQGFGLDPCQRRIARVLHTWGEPLYVLKRDIANYFPSVDHDVLLGFLQEWIEPDDYLFELVRRRVRFRLCGDEDGQNVITAERGLPFGSPISCFLANVYLTGLDRRVEQLRNVAYFRYADDILVVGRGREAALAADARIRSLLKELKLDSKASHHRNMAFLPEDRDDPPFRAVPCFRHLGLEFRKGGRVRLSRDKARKIRNLFRFAFRRARWKFRQQDDPLRRAELAVGIARRVVERGMRSVAIIDYYLKHVDDEEQLRLLDRWLAEEVLVLAFRNGHRKGNFRLLPFAQLRQMGLPSLRHRRRLLRHGHLTSSFFQLRSERMLKKA